MQNVPYAITLASDSHAHALVWLGAGNCLCSAEVRSMVTRARIMKVVRLCQTFRRCAFHVRPGLDKGLLDLCLHSAIA